MAKAIMVQGTASSAGKSLTAAGLCRIFSRDGYSVAPFKSQNMALNSFITREGLEMGRAQVTQAEAAGIEPSVLMNPILLKPTGDATSQVIVNGEVVGSMDAREYYRRKAEFLPAAEKAYRTLAAKHDIVVLEGAGSPAEINLRDDDIVNMAMAAMAGAPVLLVGDIERGGVFASLYGTVELLRPEERARIRGFVINKFRGDIDILRPGLRQLENLTGIPVVGVTPWMQLELDDEDSVTARFTARKRKALDAAIIRLPRIANFTDFTVLELDPAMGIRYVESARGLGRPDLVILPGSKNTMADLAWLRQCGLEAAVRKLAAAGVPVIGVCGGYQMLGERLMDPEGVEHGGEMRGMGLLPVETLFESRKTRTRVDGVVLPQDGIFSCLAGARFEGYEIHMGKTRPIGAARPFAALSGPDGNGLDGVAAGNVLGCYVHGLFDSGDVVRRLAERLLRDKGEAAPAEGAFDYAAHKERQYDLLADTLRNALDMRAVYGMMGLRVPEEAR